MDDPSTSETVAEKFGELSPEVLSLLEGMLRIYGIPAEELFFKWESYCIKMGPDDTKLNLDTVLAFKKDVQELFEKDMRSRPRQHGANTSRPVARTPRVKNTGDHVAFLDGLVPTTPRGAKGSVKRKFERAPFETPSSKAGRFLDANSPGTAIGSSPVGTPHKIGGERIPSTPFAQRKNAGSTVEVLNEHIPKPSLPLPESSADAELALWDSRAKLSLAVELKKFSYRPMYQKLSEASEVMDDRVDEFMDMIQEHHELADEQFGNPSTASPSEIIAVGRISCDTLDGKLSPSSVLLEASRKMGAGSRVRLKLDAVPSYSFFPGQIVAVKGVNASGEYLVVSEILDAPGLPCPASSPSALLETADRLSAGGLNIVVASGPYTTDDNLHFEALSEICNKAAESCPDVLILTGPFIDADHPLIRTGDFDFDTWHHDRSPMEDLFCQRITPKIRRVQRSLVILVPSVRDIVSKHVSFPQEQFKRKQLDLPMNVKCLPNPATFSINEIAFSVSTNDILFHMASHEINRNPQDTNPIARLSKALLGQRNLYPLFPGPSKEQLPRGTTGPNLDVPNLRLADFVGIAPDVLVLPSMLASSAKVVDSVLVLNPGFLSKRMGPGSYAEMHVLPPQVKGGEGEGELSHRVWERARVEILRI
ncbi:DNA polymerase alpha subunit B N-terminal-domain-containing protein [Tuber borchii]|uniref:DNA polymerase alpha subunit B n=1 Tax=Tuber borchii TaxID=42251 RepID=A0A2T7A174_TUBBO|nr:DNA polymerase alpha subunit B N-terminal-domain-containing protein [Tuber borchii]